MLVTKPGQDPISVLIEALRVLPGVGPKSAQRMVYHLLHKNRERGIFLAEALENAMQVVKNCTRCNDYTVSELCDVCKNPHRDKTTLCIVETPADILAIDQSGIYNGSYFVIMQKISPLDGIGPEDIGLAQLEELVVNDNVCEVILALSPTIEGQTTIHFINEVLKKYKLKVSQLAHGIPSGGELEFLDSNTISSALRNRALVCG